MVIIGSVVCLYGLISYILGFLHNRRLKERATLLVTKKDGEEVFEIGIRGGIDSVESGDWIVVKVIKM